MFILPQPDAAIPSVLIPMLRAVSIARKKLGEFILVDTSSVLFWERLHRYPGADFNSVQIYDLFHYHAITIQDRNKSG